MNNKQLKLIEHIQNSTCQFEFPYPSQEVHDEVQTYCRWFDLNEKEKQEIVDHLSEEWDQWVSDMVKEIFTYTEFDPSLVS